MPRRKCVVCTQTTIKRHKSCVQQTATATNGSNDGSWRCKWSEGRQENTYFLLHEWTLFLGLSLAVFHTAVHQRGGGCLCVQRPYGRLKLSYIEVGVGVSTRIAPTHCCHCLYSAHACPTQFVSSSLSRTLDLSFFILAADVFIFALLQMFLSGIFFYVVFEIFVCWFVADVGRGGQFRDVRERM